MIRNVARVLGVGAGVGAVVWWLRPDFIERPAKKLMPSVMLPDSMEGLGTLAEALTSPTYIHKGNYTSRLYASWQSRIYVLGPIVHAELYLMRHLQKKERLDEGLAEHARTLFRTLSRMESEVDAIGERIGRAFDNEDRVFAALHKDLTTLYRREFFEHLIQSEGGPFLHYHYAAYRSVLREVCPQKTLPDHGLNLMRNLADHMKHIEWLSELEEMIGAAIPLEAMREVTRNPEADPLQIENFVKQSHDFDPVRLQCLLLYLGPHLNPDDPGRAVGILASHLKRKGCMLVDEPDEQHQSWVRSLSEGSRIGENLQLGHLQATENQYGLGDEIIAFSDVNQLEILMRHSGSSQGGTFQELAVAPAAYFHPKGYYVKFIARNDTIVNSQEIPENFTAELRKLVTLGKLPVPVSQLDTVFKVAGNQMVYEPLAPPDEESEEDEGITLDQVVFNDLEWFCWRRSGQDLATFTRVMEETGLSNHARDKTYRLNLFESKQPAGAWGIVQTVMENCRHALKQQYILSGDVNGALCAATQRVMQRHECVFTCPPELAPLIQQEFISRTRPRAR